MQQSWKKNKIGNIRPKSLPASAPQPASQTPMPPPSQSAHAPTSAEGPSTSTKHMAKSCARPKRKLPAWMLDRAPKSPPSQPSLAQDMVIMLLRQSEVEEATLTDIYTELGSEMDQEAAIELLKQMEEQDLLRIEWNDSAVHLLC